MRLAPLLLSVALIGCGAPLGSPPLAPAATAAVDTEEISLEISALM